MTRPRSSIFDPPVLEAGSAPHTFEPGATTGRMMTDVVIALMPIGLAAVWFFRLTAVAQMAAALAAAAVTELALCRLRGRPNSLGDRSAAITALLLAFSLPPQLPLYATAMGAVVAIALGKMAFGGLGHNIFNPAMVGRAFLMACFPALMTTWSTPAPVHITTAATPLAAAKFSGISSELGPLIVGNTAGSLGETSALAILLGGLWLLARRAGDWRLTAGMLIGMVALAPWDRWIRGPEHSVSLAGHLFAGGAMLGAFFLVTDPVTSPLTKLGRWIFGLLIGVLTMLIRLFAGYPEGVMFAVLIGNAVTPLLDRVDRGLQRREARQADPEVHHTQ